MMLALVSVYSPPDEKLLADSTGALMSCKYFGSQSYRVINIKSIVAVVAMIPHPQPGTTFTESFFVVEKPGLDIALISEKGDSEADEVEET